MSISNTRQLEKSETMGSDNLSDSGSDSLSNVSDGEFSIPKYQSLLHCFALKQDLTDIELSNYAELTEREVLLANAIKGSMSLFEMREMLNQNPELVNNIMNKLFPECENICPNCNK